MPVRKTYTGQFKGNVAVAAVKAEHTLSELAAQYEVHPNQIKHWKSYLLEHVGELFEDQRRQKDNEKDATMDELYKQIGQLKVELDWVKKKLPRTVADRRAVIDLDASSLSLSRQAAL